MERSSVKNHVSVLGVIMASEGGSVPGQLGSDAEFDLTCCTPCGEDNIRQEAVKYCPECDEYLCQTCTRHHARLKATRSHKLVDKHEARPGSFIAMATKCRYHPDRDIEMYCGTHDMVYCLKCITMEHRNSCDVKCIDGNLFSSSQDDQLQALQSELKETKALLTATKESKEKHIEVVEKQKMDCITTVQKIEQKLVEHIQKLRRDATKAIETQSAEIENELKSDISSISDWITEVEKMSNQLKVERVMNTEQEFIQIKLGKKTTEDAKSLNKGIKSSNAKELYVAENADLCASVMMAVSLGKITTKKKNVTPKRMKSMREFNVKMKDDASECYITDACQLQDGTIILTDSNNMKVKRLDEKYDLKDCYTFKFRLAGICCTGPNEVAVKVSNNKVQFMSVTTSMSKLWYMPITDGLQFGIEYDSDAELFLSYTNGINRYDASGTFLKSIDRTQTGQNIFVSKPAHMVAHNGSVIVTDRRDGAVDVRKDGMVLKEFRSERLQGVGAVCRSDDGTIFLAGRDSGNIVMFGEDGNCLGDLVSTGLKQVVSLCYDNTKNCIIVTRFNCNTICVLSLDE